MRLRIVTPLAVVIDQTGVTALRAADASGSFGIQPGHADFLTSLSTTIVRWTAAGGTRQFCALQGGVFTVTGGQDIAIATRAATVGRDLATLAQTVLARFHADAEAERVERFESVRLQLSAIRHIVSHLRPAGQDGGFA
jgi:F-type H+-transporting ATPase subunit epsilon